MKFAEFPVSDQAGINAFLEQKEEFLGSNGAYVFENRVIFMWREVGETAMKREAIIEKMKQDLIMQETNLALQEVELRHTREEISHGTKGQNTSVLADAQAIFNAMKRKIEVTKKVMEQIKNGEFDI